MSFQELEAGGLRRSNNGYTNGFKQMDPTQVIASRIFQINIGVNTFQRLVNTLVTPKDTSELRDNLCCCNGGWLKEVVVIKVEEKRCFEMSFIRMRLVYGFHDWVKAESQNCCLEHKSGLRDWD
ncbi:syntaxin/t-SNARE family protein [Artemisia annua]|uniref:Syntaxin/t-SNARE family protein n=1 Tax=Artemisia annua TaxID=35608 RepID=A0A2U1P6W2_ARTAN|nr:syntaxin/t-SNARE family protein [Artemisia annua]